MSDMSSSTSVPGARPTGDGTAVVLPPSQPLTLTPEDAAATGQASPPPAAQNSKPGKVFTEEDIERARQQEKDKLYGRLTSLEQEISTWREQQEAAAKAKAEAEAENERLRKEKELAEMSALDRIKAIEDDFTQRLEAEKQAREQQQALLAKEQQLRLLEDYRNRRLTEEQENILPHLHANVVGNSEEEIEAAVSLAMAQTAAILADIQAAQQQSRPPQPRGTSVTAPSGFGPDTQSEQETLTAEQIRNMDMATYQKMRPRLLGSAANTNRGLY